MIDVDKTDLSKECVLKLKDEYDEKYKDDGKYIDYFGDFNDPAWRLDLDVSQYVSIKKDGLIYPIMFNYRSWLLLVEHIAHYSWHIQVVMFLFIMQYPKGKTKWKIELKKKTSMKDMFIWK